MTEPRAGRRPSRELSLASGVAPPEPSANSRRQLEESLSTSGKQRDKSQGPRLIYLAPRDLHRLHTSNKDEQAVAQPPISKIAETELR